MPKPRQAESPKTDPDLNLLTWLATCASVLLFLFFYRHAEVLLYGDAIAHINIARRVFDSKTPGLLQLGTVWLPLPHLLIIPFIISTELWQRGAGGSIPSMAAYVFGVIGIFRLTRTALSRREKPEGPVRIAAWTAALIYAANPNLLYMQSTAMGESLYLAFFIWALVFFTESVRGDVRALTKSALCLAAACLTRYDGWFLAAAMVIVAVVQFLKRNSNPLPEKTSRFTLIKFVLIAASAPALWLAYNGVVYRNPLEFANGPYSAKAIERKTQSTGNPGHPGSGNPVLAARYFLKSGEDNIAPNEWLQRIWILLALAAAVTGLYLARRNQTLVPNQDRPILWPLWLLLAPVPFYALSIAYSGVPIFIPNWWPFTHYNVRYGLQLLPAFAVALALLIYFALTSEDLNRRLRLACVLGISALVVVSYSSIWQAKPICLQEAETNMLTRNQLQLEVARWIEKLPPNSTILMYLGDHVGALERAAFPLKRTINEGNHRVGRQPADPEGLWEHALANPAEYVDYILAFDGDPVWQAVHDKHLHELVELHVTGQPRAVLYSAR
jgi:4-amino-4-deoxy-L-arabinose transferase-like glycosyltransferase